MLTQSKKIRNLQQWLLRLPYLLLGELGNVTETTTYRHIAGLWPCEADKQLQELLAIIYIIISKTPDNQITRSLRSSEVNDDLKKQCSHFGWAALYKLRSCPSGSERQLVVFYMVWHTELSTFKAFGSPFFNSKLLWLFPDSLPCNSLSPLEKQRELFWSSYGHPCVCILYIQLTVHTAKYQGLQHGQSYCSAKDGSKGELLLQALHYFFF